MDFFQNGMQSSSGGSVGSSTGNSDIQVSKISFFAKINEAAGLPAVKPLNTRTEFKSAANCASTVIHENMPDLGTVAKASTSLAFATVT